MTLQSNQDKDKREALARDLSKFLYEGSTRTQKNHAIDVYLLKVVDFILAHDSKLIQEVLGEVEDLLGQVRWGDYQTQDGSWHYGVANKPELIARLKKKYGGLDE